MLLTLGANSTRGAQRPWKSALRMITASQLVLASGPTAVIHLRTTNQDKTTLQTLKQETNERSTRAKHECKPKAFLILLQTTSQLNCIYCIMYSNQTKCWVLLVFNYFSRDKFLHRSQHMNYYLRSSTPLNPETSYPLHLGLIKALDGIPWIDPEPPGCCFSFSFSFWFTEQRYRPSFENWASY